MSTTEQNLGNPAMVAAAAQNIKVDRTVQIIGATVIGGLVIYGVYRVSKLQNGILESIGLKDSREDKDTQKKLQQAETSNAFSPSYWRTVNAPSWRTTTAVDVARMIEDSWGFINDDEKQVVAAFRLLPSKSHVSQVASEYIRLFRVDLLADLKDRMSESELRPIMEYIDRLPNQTMRLAGIVPSQTGNNPHADFKPVMRITAAA